MTAREFPQAWAALRATLNGGFSFYQIKEIVGLGGLDLTNLSDFEQKTQGGASIGQLLTGIDRALRELDDDARRRFLGITTEEVLRRRPEVEGQLKHYLSRLGWALIDGAIIPLQIFDVEEWAELPPQPRQELVKAAQRFRDGDLSGAISAACGAVDIATTQRITALADIRNSAAHGNPGEFSEDDVSSMIRDIEQFLANQLA
jgi:hypothetical protein